MEGKTLVDTEKELCIPKNSARWLKVLTGSSLFLSKSSRYTLYLEL